MFTNLQVLQGLPALENVVSPLEGLGLVAHRGKGCLKVVWDFAVQGGAIGTLKLLDDVGNAAILPNKTIITGVYCDFSTACTSGGSATIGLVANSANDLLTATAVASCTGLVAGTPVSTAATAVKLTADRQISLVIAVAALTNGKAQFIVEYAHSN